MKAFLASVAATLLLGLPPVSLADEPPTLPTIPVHADYCDYVINCTYAPGYSAFLVPMAPAFPPAADSIDVGYDDPLVATCDSLRARARGLGCNLNDTPPAPGFPSPTRGQWASNGCGDGKITTAMLIELLGDAIDGYTGDPTHPLPGVSFESPCATHDECYYLSASRTLCDSGFAISLDNVCHQQTTGFAQCMAFAGAYATAVDQYGQGDYADNQQTMECAKINSDLDHGNCVDDA